MPRRPDPDVPVRLVEVAAELLATEGGPGVTARRVAAGAGVSTQAVYTHFGGMDDLDDLWRPAHVVEPTDPSSHQQRRERWADALRRAGGWHADLSALEF